MLHIILCSSLILPLAISGSLVTNSSKLSETNEKTKLTLNSEGGTVIASTPDLSLPNKDKQVTNLLTLDEELETQKKASIKPRKGVAYTKDSSNVTIEITNDTDNQKISSATNESHPPIPKILTSGNDTNFNLNTSKPTSPIVPKKPLILSYEALVNSDKNVQDELKGPAVNPSPKSLPNAAKNQIPSPNEEIVKVYPSKANSHPGMIMPIVITILVVPMFAIVGYMALKRGKEAWKNRHYKRMDFLLDGMYND